MPYVSTSSGHRLYVKDWGSGPAVVLIHGWPLSADMWEQQAVALVDAGFRVIAYDRRGFGRSDQPGQGFDYDTLADDLAAVIDQAGAERPAIVGFSMGGGEVARYLGRRAGPPPRAAVLVSSVVPGLAKSDANPHGLDASALQEILDGLAKDRPHFIAGFGEKFVGAGLLSTPVSAEVMDWMLMMAMQASPLATRECAKAFAATDFAADLACFTCPTLIIHGDADKTVPIDPTARRAREMLPDAEYREYAGAPHGLFLTDAERLSADLVEFLGRSA